MNRRTPLLLAIVALAASAPFLLHAPEADAFCGFYVGGAGQEMFADATNVTLMREGTRTVLSMQNRYDGPIKDFALVIPVPIVMEEENVKTLPEDVFTRVDQLTSPRLVEYWERDPCAGGDRNFFDIFAPGDEAMSGGDFQNSADSPVDEEVVVEGEFTVGEYDIVILSTQDSTALENWLNDYEYNIPDDAAPYFEPYVQSGMYFFVARVNPEEVSFVDNQAVLSPLRFHYDTDDFWLPVRLGMINSRGEQDLIVNILAKDQRYELANYPNVTIPTNLYVDDSVRDDFGSFYRALFARTVEENPGAAVTEYSWGAGNCDPCPGPVAYGLPNADIATLGGDVMPGEGSAAYEWTITRLHLRYGQDEVGEDLIFQQADPIVGGRQHIVTETGELEEGSQPATSENRMWGGGNQFQGRYIIQHLWDGAINCREPNFGNWGGPPSDVNRSGAPLLATSPNTSGDDVFLDTSDVDLDQLIVAGSVDTTDYHNSRGCGGCAAAPSKNLPFSLVLLLAATVLFKVTRRRREA